MPHPYEMHWHVNSMIRMRLAQPRSTASAQLDKYFPIAFLASIRISTNYEAAFCYPKPGWCDITDHHRSDAITFHYRLFFGSYDGTFHSPLSIIM